MHRASIFSVLLLYLFVQPLEGQPLSRLNEETEALMQAGKWEAAAQAARHALSTARQAGWQQLYDYTDALFNQAYVSYHFQDLTAAITALEESCELLKQHQEWEEYAGQGEYLGAFLYLNQAYGQAFEELSQVVSRLPVGTTGSGDKAHHFLGLLYQRRDNYQKALRHFSQALRLRKAQQDSLMVLESWLSLGELYVRADSVQRARHYADSIAHWQAMMSTPGKEAELWELRGRIYEQEGLLKARPRFYQQAMQAHRRALKLRKAAGNRQGTANSLLNIGAAHEYLLQPDSAREYYEQALLLLDATAPKDLLAKLYLNLSDCYAAMNNKAQAAHSFKQCLELQLDAQYQTALLEHVRFKNEHLNRLMLQNQQQAFQNKLMGGLLLFVLLLLGLSVLYVSERMRHQKVQARSNLLQLIDQHAQNVMQTYNDAADHSMKKISRELHDSICQELLLLSRRLEGIERQLGKEQASLKQAVGCVLAQIGEISDSLRGYSHDLSALALQEGLCRAITDLQQKLKKSNFDLRVDTMGMQGRRFDGQIELNMYRIIQEALSNTLKYAGVNSLQLQCVFAAPDDTQCGTLSIMIEDEGAGFDPDMIRPGLGMESMQKRAQALGGSFKLDSAPGKGTLIHVLIPIPKNRMLTT
ncbi:MAG: tetratricopeptide repeat protein [Bacteroidetes bacterium]|nr:MAG: tetratricopeptide repeat protein [Bacteroidota bacterium]